MKIGELMTILRDLQYILSMNFYCTEINAYNMYISKDHMEIAKKQLQSWYNFFSWIQKTSTIMKYYFSKSFWFGGVWRDLVCVQWLAGILLPKYLFCSSASLSDRDAKLTHLCCSLTPEDFLYLLTCSYFSLLSGLHVKSSKACLVFHRCLGELDALSRWLPWSFWQTFILQTFLGVM